MRSVVITGFPRHRRYLANLLNGYSGEIHAAYFSDTRIALLRAALFTLRADAAISFGGPWPKELVERICAARGRPMILLWGGSDVVRIAGAPSELERLRLANIVHWACAEHLAAELQQLGIHARYVPVASAAVPARIAPMPDDFTVVTYLPEPRRSFYGRSMVWELARSMQHIRFVVCGPGGPERDAPSNIEYAGDVPDMNALLDSSSLLLRLPQHDGLSMSVIEALARGRHVIWTYPLPGVVNVSSQIDAAEALHRLYDAHRRGALETNREGMHYAAEHHHPHAITRGILAALDEAIADKLTISGLEERSADKCQLAISGPEVLAARVARNAVRYSKRLSGSVLSARSHCDAAISTLKLAASDVWYTIGVPHAPGAFELAARLLHKRRIVHWLGKDVELLAQSTQLLRNYRAKRYAHVAQNEDVARRLREFGLRANVVPLPAAVPVANICPLPKQFTLLLYVPPERPEFYGRYQFERLMTALSGENVHYIVFGGGRIDVPAGISSEQLSWQCDLDTIYDRATVLVCFMQPNAASMMPVDALLHGRYVLCSNEFPYAMRVRDSHELESTVRALLRQHDDGALMPLYEAAHRTADIYSPQHCLTMLAQIANRDSL